MECRYCQTLNGDDDHRCRRCGRRMQFAPAYLGSSAAAPVLNFDANQRPAVAPIPPPAARPPQLRKPITYQQSLFTPRIVPFETIAPSTTRPSAPPSTALKTARKARAHRTSADQQNLEFAPARSSRTAENGIYCGAPVAVQAHRVMAAAIDATIVTIAIALFGLVFRLAGGQFVFNATTLPCYAVVATALMVFYRLLWCLANGDSAGMRWTRLLLVNFDGQMPTRSQRLSRAASGFLSLAAGGLGLLWALVDEETLTWHDHISKTFPTPY